MPTVACRLLVAHFTAPAPAPGPGFGGEDEAAGPDDAGAGGADTAVGLVADEVADAGAGAELAGLPGLAELATDDPDEVHPATRAATAQTAATAAAALMAPNRRVRPAGFIQLILSFWRIRVIQPPKTPPE
jgi:hypothetical protein